MPTSGAPVDATFTLELDQYNGIVEPRLVLRHAQACAPAAVQLVGEPEEDVAAALAEAVGADAPASSEGRPPRGAEAAAGATAPPPVLARARPALHDRRELVGHSVLSTY